MHWRSVFPLNLWPTLSQQSCHQAEPAGNCSYPSLAGWCAVSELTLPYSKFSPSLFSVKRFLFPPLAQCVMKHNKKAHGALFLVPWCMHLCCEDKTKARFVEKDVISFTSHTDAVGEGKQLFKLPGASLVLK